MIDKLYEKLLDSQAMLKAMKETLHQIDPQYANEEAPFHAGIQALRNALPADHPVSLDSYLEEEERDMAECLLHLFWKGVKLKQYEAKRESLKIIPKQITEIDSTMTSIRSTRTDGVPVKGGDNGRENLMLNCIVQKEELKSNLDRVQNWVEIVDAGLSVLGSDDRLVLDRFYIHPEKYAADRLAGDLGIDVKTVYARKDRALRKFTIALYGTIES